MKTFATSAALLSAVSAVLAQNGGAVIQSPASLVQCQPVLLSWNGGEGPYYVSVIPGGQASAAALKTFPVQQSATSLTWIVDLAVQEISLKIVDASGVPNYSSPIPIQAGGDTSCLNGGGASASTTAAAAPASTTPSSRPATTAAASPSTTTVQSRPASSSSSMATSVRPASSSSSASSAASSGTSSGSGSASPIPPAAASPTTATGGAGKLMVNAVGLAGVAGLVALFA